MTLIVHLASAGTWLGMNVVFGILAFATLESTPEVAAPFVLVLATFIGWPLVGVALLTLLSGVVLALGSKYQLLRYWWVLAKLVLITLVMLVLLPSVAELTADATAPAASTEFSLGPQLIFPPIVSSSALLFAMTISVIKPWGRARRTKLARTEVVPR